MPVHQFPARPKPRHSQQRHCYSAQRRQTQVDINVGKQAALRNYVGLEQLQYAQRRIASRAAIVRDQAAV
jgi:hypothetical protein